MAGQRHVIIAGGGIAGLTTALAMSRAGIRSTVLEQAPALEEAGAGIQLSPNATRVLIALGLGERMRSVAVAPQALRVMSAASGSQIARIPLGQICEQRYGAPYWTVHRGDLQAALAEAVRVNPGITLKLATKIEDYAVHAQGVTVQGRRGLEVVDERGSMLVGADGLWSSVRGRLIRSRPPAFRHRTAWRALVPADQIAPQWREPLVYLWLGADAHLVHYPVKGGSLINIVAIVHDQWSEQGWSAPGDRNQLLRHFARWSWGNHAREVLDAPQRWLKWALYDRPAPFYGDGGLMTLVGDAAHPMLPFLAQGAGMAIEDAIVLAAALLEENDDESGLRLYERARKKRIAKVQGAARKQGRINGMTGPEALVRNLGMRVLGGDRLLARQDWLYGWEPPPLPR